MKRSTTSLTVLTSALFIHLASAGCQAHEGTCGVQIVSEIPLLSNGFLRRASVFDRTCTEFAQVDMGIDDDASITSRLPYTVEVHLDDGAGGFEPLGTIAYLNRAVAADCFASLLSEVLDS
ncbi:uncharacterized protein CkaCkLH20_07940 [Neofusicoccum parvum]|nr:uncharacterized protein CkaCkLH20_07940 [Neofusicoccum parvum]